MEGYMTAIDRRKLMVGGAVGAAAAVAAVVPALAAATDTSDLTRLIEAHRAAFKAFDAAIDVEQELDGRQGSERKRSAAAELDAFYEVCNFHCKSIEEAKLKAKYLLTTYLVKDSWDAEAKALLQSFAGEVQS
jgi:hypothetical protein